jgi:hypothetical protein
MKQKGKKIYLEFVMLTDEQYKSLCDRFGQSCADDWIEQLNNGIGSKGYRYDSHYHTILSWSRRVKKTGAQATDLSADANILINALEKYASMPQDLPKAIADRCLRMCREKQVSWPRLHHRIGLDPTAAVQIRKDYLGMK